MNRPPENLIQKAEEALFREDHVAAIEWCRKALTRDSRDYQALVMLSYALRIQGEFEESAAIAERAIRLRPGMVEAYFQFALCMLATGRYEIAVSTLKRAVSLRPDQAVLHMNLGLAFEYFGKRELAMKSYREASKLNPDDLQSRLASIAHLVQQDRFDAARMELEPLLRRQPDSAEVQLSMAELCIAESGMAAAEPFIRNALKLDTENTKANALLGFRMSELGDFDAAGELFQKSLSIDPNQGHAYLGLCQSRKLSEDDRPLIQQMEQLRDRTILPPDEAGALRFALAKAYDNLGEYELAMRHYDEAHQQAYLARFGSEPFKNDQYGAAIDAIIAAHPAQTRFAPTPIAPIPILIVGMIRSGTTLTEQILSRHPRVAGAGEHLFWHQHAGTPERHARLASHPEELASLASKYLEALRQVDPHADRITDKLPGNYLRLGVIRSALPGAKIIHCRRNPIDHALSIYFTPIKTSSAFSHSKDSIVYAYRQYQRLMDHWRDVLPSENFLEIQYEDLVDDPEPNIRRMLDFCELEWDDRCLTPEANTKEVKTASLWQVRQPIYRSSVDRWRKYEPWLGPLSELLQPSS